MSQSHCHPSPTAVPVPLLSQPHSCPSLTVHRQFDLRIRYIAGIRHLQDQSNTVILDSYVRYFGHSYFGHRYSGQLFWTQLCWTVILDTVILSTVRQYFRAVVIGLNLDKLNPHSHPIKFLHSPKRTINRSPTHTLQYPPSTGLLAKGSNVPSPNGDGASHQQNSQQSKACT